MNTGPICLDELVTVLAQYDPRQRWNGFLCPRMDALAVVTVIEAMHADYADAPFDHLPPTIDWSDDGTLLVTEYDGETAAGTDRLTPDEDGLYALGAHCWVWSEDTEPETAWFSALPKAV